jgi:hypothetical protein
MISLKQWNALANPGDIVGFSGRNLASDIINVGTYAMPRWGLSHVGILCPHPDYGLLLYESTTFNSHPCVIQKKAFQGTQAQYPRDKVFTYDGRVWLYSLNKPLNDIELLKLQVFLNGTIGTPYDMIGAFRSGGEGFRYMESKMHSENMSSIFCSEWCAAAMREMERFSTDDVSKWNPNALCRELLRSGEVISPVRVK